MNELPAQEPRPVMRSGLWPDATQRRLLRLCLELEPDVPLALQMWRQDVNLDAPSTGTYRLLPMLAPALRRAGLQADPVARLAADVARRSWARNRLKFRVLGELDDTFVLLGVRYAVLKGLGLIIDGSYRSAGERPASDVDVLIDPEHVDAVRRSLIDSGWRAPPEEAQFDTAELMAGFHAASFERGHEERLDLHWGAFHTYGAAQQRAYAFLLDNARSYELDGRHWPTLAPTEQLLHTAVHGARRAQEEPVRWLADATQLLRRHGDEIDWGRLVTLAERLQRSTPLEMTLRYLADELDAPVPPEALEALASVRPGRLERLETWLDGRPKGSLLQYVKRGCRIARMARYEQPGRLDRLARAGWYAKAWWHVPESEPLVSAMVKRIVSRSGRSRSASRQDP